jgi:hypothetical protein
VEREKPEQSKGPVSSSNTLARVTLRSVTFAMASIFSFFKEGGGREDEERNT